jgi:hypothetical protein
VAWSGYRFLPGRQYGNAANVALMLGGIPELAPGADNGMKQDHYDALGMWMAPPAQPTAVSRWS